MSDDLGRMFASLSSDSDHRSVLEAETLRTKVNRRTRARTAVTGGALAVVVGGVLFAGQSLLGRPAPHDPAVVPSASAPVSPSPSPSVSKPPAVPKSIPAKAFLQKSDLNDNDGGVDPQDKVLPELCGADYASDRRIAVDRSVHFQFRAQDQPEENVPDGTLEQTIRVYQGDGARQFMREIKSAVSACPEDDGATNETTSLTGAGDEAIMINISYDPSGDPARTAVVRVGDMVTVLVAGGWEEGGVQEETITFLARAAAGRLESWR